VTAVQQAGPPLIQLRGVTKVYGTGAAAVHALAGVDVTIDDGEFVAIMGASGSGKSTAMNVIGFLDTPTSGQYRFMGVDGGGLTRDQRTLLRRHFLGFVFQGFNLLTRTTAVENVELPLIYRGMAQVERRRWHWMRWSALDCTTASITPPRSCPAESSSALQSPAPSSPIRQCSWPMSRPAIWTA
jgi:ABC-type lipoprotein export system ATPase subunit